MNNVWRLVGAAIALAGSEKLFRERGYARLFQHLGWSKRSMRTLAAAEFAGGVLMVPEATRRLGGTVVAAASLAVLAAELRHGDEALAAERGLVLLAGVAALVAG